MPQLDKVHFFSQFFWLCVFYFGFYFLIVKHFLPKMARIRQFRKDKLTASPQENVGQELQLVQDSGKTALENVFTTSHKFWSRNSQRMQEWYGNQVRTLNNNYLKECNNLYIKKVGDYSLTQNAALQGLALSAPSATFAWLLTHKFKQPVPTVKNDDNKLKNAISFTTSSKPVNKKFTLAGQSNNYSASSLGSSSPGATDQSTQAHTAAANKKGKKGKK